MEKILKSSLHGARLHQAQTQWWQPFREVKGSALSAPAAGPGQPGPFPGGSEDGSKARTGENSGDPRPCSPHSRTF